MNLYTLLRTNLQKTIYPVWDRDNKKPYPVSHKREYTPMGRKHCLKLDEKLSRVLIIPNKADKSQPICYCIFTSISTLILGLMVQFTSISP